MDETRSMLFTLIIAFFWFFIFIKEWLLIHIPDNYVSPETCAVVTTAMLPVWNRVIKKSRKK